MPTLIIETEINASPAVCFGFIRDVSLRLQTPGKTDKTAFAGKSHGEIELGETVTFEETRFGLTQRLIVKVTELEKPFCFTDEMIEGNFKAFKHIHEFIPQNNQTLLRDTLVWTSPLGILGKLADLLLLKDHLRKVVLRRNAELKKAAEDCKQKDL